MSRSTADMVEDESNGHDPFLEAMAMPGPATGDGKYE
jgi:hypothetical protein